MAPRGTALDTERREARMADNFSWFLQQFLVEHPSWREQSETIAQQTGSEEVYLSTTGMVEFVKWSRRKRFLGGRDGQRALTLIRELEYVMAHPRPPANDAEERSDDADRAP